MRDWPAQKVYFHISQYAENNRGAEEYVQRLVEHYVDHDAWFRQEVKKGLDQLGRGESLTDKEVGARIEKMFRS